MAKIIAVANQKGGTAKTTTTAVSICVPHQTGPPRNPSTRGQFERLVQRALAQLPKDLERYLDNAAILIDEEAPDHLRGWGLILGRYEGVPRTARERTSYSMVPPDRIVLYWKSFQRLGLSERELVREIERTIVHEIGHHLGIDERGLMNLGV